MNNNNHQQHITIDCPAMPARSYPVFTGTGLLKDPLRWLPEKFREKHLVIITDHTVKKIYGLQLASSLKNCGRGVIIISFPPGEHAKNASTKARLENAMHEQHCNRDSVILALGGGVCGDMAGFIAATFMRGIPCIQLPTTLLAMVDSSIGGKTAINTAYGKNLSGAFWQPACVVADLQCLSTLHTAHRDQGLIEILKIFTTSDAANFNWLAENYPALRSGDLSLLEKAILPAIRLKAAIVYEDETDQGIRQILNFGHTIGHALEKISAYALSHGTAVGLGMLVETAIAQLLGILRDDSYQKIKTTLNHSGILPAQLAQYDVDRLVALTHRDKKSTGQQARYVLLHKTGDVFVENHHTVHPVDDATVRQALLLVAKDRNP